MTGQEVSITVTFNPPIALPPSEYFFRPEVGLSSGNFLWLSAPKPISLPGRRSPLIGKAGYAMPILSRTGCASGPTSLTRGPFNASFFTLRRDHPATHRGTCSGVAVQPRVGRGKITASTCPLSRTWHRCLWTRVSLAGNRKARLCRPQLDQTAASLQRTIRTIRSIRSIKAFLGIRFDEEPPFVAGSLK